jgi:hypothetical protein
LSNQVVIGQPGKDGKDGKPGSIGLVGPQALPVKTVSRARTPTVKSL